jgi:hypothetical protein
VDVPLGGQEPAFWYIHARRGRVGGTLTRGAGGMAFLVREHAARWGRIEG